MDEANLGIDVSKGTLEVGLVRPDEPGAQITRFDNTLTGFKRLSSWLKQQGVERVHACLEATGLYGDEVALYLYEVGHTVSVVNPARIKAYAASQLQRNKTDRLDAALIADFCRTQAPPAWTPPDPAWQELRALARHLTDLKDMRQQERNRLKAGVSSPTVRQVLAAHIAFLDQQIADLEQHIQDHIRHHPDLQQQQDLITSIPGLGKLSAALILAEIRDIRAFEHAGQVVAFAGLNPRQRRSGTSVRGQTALSKTGSAALRRALYFPALSAKRCNPVIAPWCADLAARGKTKMQVIGAAMRKLLILVYGVLKSGQPFDPHYHARLLVAP
jgi:transposase